MGKPLLVLVNGLPGTGKTTLAKRLSIDTSMPVFSRDGLYEKLYDALECRHDEVPTRLGAASFSLLYYVTGLVLAAGQSVIVEGFFGRSELRTAEFLNLQLTYDFEPFQILCMADGSVLVERFIERMGTETRHTSHQDHEWLEQNKALLLEGSLPPLSIGGQLVEINTTSAESFDYDELLRHIYSFL